MGTQRNDLDQQLYKKYSKIGRGQVFVHIKTGNEYVFDGLRMCKTYGVWRDYADYYRIGEDSPRYSFGRTLYDFDDKFKIVEGKFVYH